MPPVIFVGPVIVLPAQEPPSPKVTSPVSAVIVTNPVRVESHAWIAPAPVAVSEPVMLALSMSSEPPAALSPAR